MFEEVFHLIILLVCVHLGKSFDTEDYLDVAISDLSNGLRNGTGRIGYAVVMAKYVSLMSSGIMQKLKPITEDFAYCAAFPSDLSDACLVAKAPFSFINTQGPNYPSIFPSLVKDMTDLVDSLALYRSSRDSYRLRLNEVELATNVFIAASEVCKATNCTDNMDWSTTYRATRDAMFKSHYDMCFLLASVSPYYTATQPYDIAASIFHRQLPYLEPPPTGLSQSSYRQYMQYVFEHIVDDVPALKALRSFSPPSVSARDSYYGLLVEQAVRSVRSVFWNDSVDQELFCKHAFCSAGCCSTGDDKIPVSSIALGVLAACYLSVFVLMLFVLQILKASYGSHYISSALFKNVLMVLAFTGLHAAALLVFLDFSYWFSNTPLVKNKQSILMITMLPHSIAVILVMRATGEAKSFSDQHLESHKSSEQRFDNNDASSMELTKPSLLVDDHASASAQDLLALAPTKKHPYLLAPITNSPIPHAMQSTRTNNIAPRKWPYNKAVSRSTNVANIPEIYDSNNASKWASFTRCARVYYLQDILYGLFVALAVALALWLYLGGKQFEDQELTNATQNVCIVQIVVLAVCIFSVLYSAFTPLYHMHAMGISNLSKSDLRVLGLSLSAPLLYTASTGFLILQYSVSSTFLTDYVEALTATYHVADLLLLVVLVILLLHDLNSKKATEHSSLPKTAKNAVNPIETAM